MHTGAEKIGNLELIALQIIVFHYSYGAKTTGDLELHACRQGIHHTFPSCTLVLRRLGVLHCMLVGKVRSIPSHPLAVLSCVLLGKI